MTSPNHSSLAERSAANAMGESLTCRRYTVGDCTVVVVVGDVDESSSAALRKELQAAAEHGGARIVVDLTGVTFLGCAGIGELIQALRRTGWSPGSIRLAGARESVRRTLQATHADTVFPIYDSLDVAVDSQS